MNALYTIGFAAKSLEEFVTRLRGASVQRLVDIRLRPSSQLSGYARQVDLRYVLEAYVGIEYVHSVELAPTGDILDGYRKSKDWADYETAFHALMEQRGMVQILEAVSLGVERVALLCSENDPKQCHRRLLAERYAQLHPGLTVSHL